MEGHAAMDMTIQAEGSLWQRLRTRQAFTSVSHVFVMEWAAIRDVAAGLLIAGAAAAWVPGSFLGPPVPHRGPARREAHRPPDRPRRQPAQLRLLHRQRPPSPLLSHRR